MKYGGKRLTLSFPRRFHFVRETERRQGKNCCFVRAILSSRSFRFTSPAMMRNDEKSIYSETRTSRSRLRGVAERQGQRAETLAEIIRVSGEESRSFSRQLFPAKLSFSRWRSKAHTFSTPTFRAPENGGLSSRSVNPPRCGKDSYVVDVVATDRENKARRRALDFTFLQPRNPLTRAG